MLLRASVIRASQAWKMEGWTVLELNARPSGMLSTRTMLNRAKTREEKDYFPEGNLRNSWQTTSVFHFCADVCLLAGVWAAFGLTEAAAQGWMEERNPRGQEREAGHRGQQYYGQSDENHHTSGILEEKEQQCGVMDRDQLKHQNFICWWLFFAECSMCVRNIQTELSWCAPVSSSAFHPASSIKEIKIQKNWWTQNVRWQTAVNELLHWYFCPRSKTNA